MGSQIDAGLGLGGSQGSPLGLACLTDLADAVHDAAELGDLHGSTDTEAVASGGQELRQSCDGGGIKGEGCGLQLRDALAYSGDGTGIGHGQRVAAADANMDILQLRHGSIQTLDEGGELGGQHGAGGVADSHGGGTGSDGGLQSSGQERGIGTSGIICQKFHIGAQGLTGGDGIRDRLLHGFGLFVVEIFHLHGADSTGDLQAGGLGALQSGPDLRGALLSQLYGNGDRAAIHSGGDRFDPQAVDTGIFDALQLDHRYTQLVQ